MPLFFCFDGTAPLPPYPCPRYWLVRLNDALALYDPLFIIPLLQANFIFFAIMSGGIYFQEFNYMTPIMWVGFTSGVIVIFSGLYFLAPSPPTSEELPHEPTAERSMPLGEVELSDAYMDRPSVAAKLAQSMTDPDAVVTMENVYDGQPVHNVPGAGNRPKRGSVLGLIPATGDGIREGVTSATSAKSMKRYTMFTMGAGAKMNFVEGNANLERMKKEKELQDVFEATSGKKQLSPDETARIRALFTEVKTLHQSLELDNQKLATFSGSAVNADGSVNREAEAVFRESIATATARDHTRFSVSSAAEAGLGPGGLGDAEGGAAIYRGSIGGLFGNVGTTDNSKRRSSSFFSYGSGGGGGGKKADKDKDTRDLRRASGACKKGMSPSWGHLLPWNWKLKISLFLSHSLNLSRSARCALAMCAVLCCAVPCPPDESGEGRLDRRVSSGVTDSSDEAASDADSVRNANGRTTSRGSTDSEVDDRTAAALLQASSGGVPMSSV